VPALVARASRLCPAPRGAGEPVNPPDPDPDALDPGSMPGPDGAPTPDWRTWWERETALTLGERRASDPFAARRAEPRLFAFFWTVYLLAAVLGAVFWLARTPISGPSAFSPAARTMLVVIAAGVVILWPMTRLSQLAPARPVVRAVALDLLVMLGPAQMVIWPLVFLAAWPVKVVAAVSAQLGGWGALVGGIVALALVARSRTGGLAGGVWKPGVGWMSAIVVLVVFLPMLVRLLAGAGAGGVGAPDWAGAFSPFDFGGSMLGQGVSGPTGSPSRGRWVGIGVLWALAAGPWVVAAANEATGNRTERGRFV